MKQASRTVLLASIFLVLFCSFARAQPSTADKDAVGYSALLARLGPNMPTGAGIPVTLVEAVLTTGGTDYLPDPNHPEFAGKSIVDRTGGGTTSGHATTVGRNYFGLASFAPGITSVDVYRAESWLYEGGLQTQSALAPAVETARVQNHSWIGTLGGTAVDVDALRRLDYLIQRDDVVVAAGVNNGATTTVPNLLASSYNAIAVGLSSGASSLGPTPIDVPGRAKPDIVAPAVFTSYSTPWVAGSAALLLDSANNSPAYANAQHSESVKAMLMAGTTRTGLAGWSHSSTQPLDLRYGAGQLNIDLAYRILTSGEQTSAANALAAPMGWDFDTIASGQSKLYFFDLANPSSAGLTGLLTWNRQITLEAGDPATLTPSLANLDLKLYQASGFSLGALLEQSISTLDNVELVFLQNVTSGRYALEVTRGIDGLGVWDYALAWHAVPEPSTWAMLVSGAVLACGGWRLRHRACKRPWA